MSNKALPVFVNLAGFAAVAGIGAWWALRILTPSPSAIPPAAPAAPVREVDPVAAARMFGKVEAAAGPASVQAMGVFSAGAASSAVLAVDGRPARVFLIGQEVAPGLRLAEVGPGGVVLASGEARQEVRVPARPPAALLDSPPVAPRHSLQDQVLSAPSVTGAPATAPRPLEPAPGTPQPMPAGAPLPKFESPILQPPPPLPGDVPQPRDR